MLNRCYAYDAYMLLIRICLLRERKYNIQANMFVNSNYFSILYGKQRVQRWYNVNKIGCGN